MIINEQNEDLIRRFVEQLESYGIEIGTKLDRMEKEKQSYLFFEEVLERIREDKVAFCTSYLIMTDEEQALFQKRLLDLFKDQEIVDNILQEIVNLYYLKESGLLELDEIAPQKEVAYENLDTLATKIEKFLKENNIDQLTADAERLSLSLDRLVDLGSIMEGEENTPVSDVDFLEEVLEASNLSKEERKTLLEEVIQYNLDTYRKNLERKAAREELSEELEELEVDERLTITPECARQIQDLLSRREIIEKIVRVVNDDYEMVINVSLPSREDQDLINDSVDLAREVITESIQEEESLTPEEALERFFKKYDESKQRKEELIDIIFEEAPESELPLEEQKETVAEAMAFLQQNKGYISLLSRQDKERINQYTREYYSKKENRLAVYTSKAYTSKDDIVKEVAYELQILKELLDVVEEGSIEYSKISRRVQEILECAQEATMEEQEEIKEGNLFFLGEDGKVSLIESDMGLDKARGMSDQYIKDVLNQLSAISARKDGLLRAEQPSNPSYKNIKKLRVHYTNGNRTRVFFIPVGKSDAIIVGTSVVDGKDNLKSQDTRLKRYIPLIEELKERLQQEDTYREELNKAQAIQRRMNDASGDKELAEMFEESDVQEETTQSHK